MSVSVTQRGAMLAVFQQSPHGSFDDLGYGTVTSFAAHLYRLETDAR